MQIICILPSVSSSTDLSNDLMLLGELQMNPKLWMKLEGEGERPQIKLNHKDVSQKLLNHVVT
jgi:hypothetical protein